MGGLITSPDTLKQAAAVPILAPDGSAYAVPQERVQEALQQGGKVGASVRAPNGDYHVIPIDRVHDAIAAGGVLDTPSATESHPLQTFADTLSNLAKGFGNMLATAGGTDLPTSPDLGSQVAAERQQQEQRNQTGLQGRSLPYRAISELGGLAGVDVAGQEKAAAEGRMGDIAASAAGSAAPVAVAAAAPSVVRALGAAGEKTLLLGRTPAEAYQSALKPSTTLSEAERANIVQTGLEQKIPVSKAGVERINNLLGDLQQKVDATVATRPNAPIDPNAAATKVDEIAPRFANQVNAAQDLSALEASKQQFLAERGAKPAQAAQPTGLLDAQGNPIMRPATPATPAPPMTAEAAQAMKKGTYRNLGDKAYGELQTATMEAQKALARGLKDELVTQFPELSELNKTESRLYDLQPVLEKAVNRIGNHQLIGIGTPVVAGAAKALTGSATAGTAAGILKAVLDQPMVKSRLAIALNRSGVPMSAANARIAGYATSLESAAQGRQNPASDGSSASPATPQP